MERISDKWLWGEQGDPDETAVSLRCELKGAETLFFLAPPIGRRVGWRGRRKWQTPGSSSRCLRKMRRCKS
jgi:hypothetical protein